jgi:GT2 family glycosyltransferase
MKDKLYCLVIVVFNRLDKLKLLIESIKTDLNIRILLFDNGSSQETVDYIKEISKDPRVFITFEAYNKGFAYALNRGCDFAFTQLKADGVFFIDSDVVLGKGCLENLISFQKKSKAAGVFSQDQKTEGFSFGEFSDPKFKPSYNKEMMLTTECCYFPAETLLGVDYFDEMFYPVYMEDMDYFYRIKLRGGKLLHCKTANHFHFRTKFLEDNDEFARYKRDRFYLLDEYYRYKWGGPPGQERFKKPFNTDGIGISK